MVNVSCTLPHVHSTSPGLGLAVPVLAAETVVVVVEGLTEPEMVQWGSLIDWCAVLN